MKSILLIFGLILCVVFTGCGKPVSRPFESGPGVVESLPSEPQASEVISKEELQNLTIEDLKNQSIEHEIKPGETLSEIAAKYDVGVGLLARLNQIEDPNRIRVGQKVKVIQGPFRIVIHKKDRTLSILLKDLHFKTYDVAIGKQNSTPEGEFKILEKMVKPIWTDPYEGGLVKPDDPRYPLGTRWMLFAEYGYGIHGTNDPASIKTEASFGCIRMLNPDVEEVYDLLSIGSQILILP
jgi:lipoprotein-anchoring transpeptidase ErfK/SrfK